MPIRDHRHPAPLALAIVALCTTILMLAFPAVSNARPAKDPVVAAINSARMKRQITYQQTRELQRDWALSARAQRVARSASRRAAIASVRSYTTNLAQGRGLTAERLPAVMLSVKATTTIMLRGSYPGHEQEVQIPGEVVVFTYYSGRGVQFQPFETFKQGMRELNQKEPDIDAAREIADRMLELSVRRGSSITWEYYFPFGGPSTPWTSAISQGLATELLYRVGQAVPEGEGAPYLAAADDVARSFLRSTKVGGLGVADGDGRYYVMYSFAPWQRILNGHLQVLINLNRYATATGSVAARRVVDQGISAVVPLLPKFDTGGWSNYQPGQEADLNYHEFQSGQLVKLGEETGNPTFSEYGSRFTSYLETPPTVSFPSPLYPAIFPADDDFRDGIDVPVTVNKRSRITLVVYDAHGDEMGRTSIWRGRGTGVVTWDGTDRNGRRAPAGTYTGRITATDIVKNRAFVDLEAPLRVIADETPPTLRVMTLRERRGTSIVTANAFDMASGSITARIRIDGKIVAFAKGGRSGTITLRTRRALADVKRGELLLRDTSGNELVQPITPG
jgi:hypothetical protein